MGSIFGFILKATATVFITFFVLYPIYYWWDMRNLRSFCDAVKVGTPVTALAQIAEHHSISSNWLRGDGVFNEREKYWSIYVPSTASVGSNVCAIRHDKMKVISAIIEID